MAMKIWQLVFFQPLQKRLTSACCQLIDAERRNETINAQSIRTVVQYYSKDQNSCFFLEAYVENFSRVRVRARFICVK